MLSINTTSRRMLIPTTRVIQLMRTRRRVMGMGMGIHTRIILTMATEIQRRPRLELIQVPNRLSHIAAPGGSAARGSETLAAKEILETLETHELPHPLHLSTTPPTSATHTTGAIRAVRQR